MLKPRLAIAFAIAAPLALSGTAFAQDADAEPGFYLGAGVTQSRWDADNFDVEDLDDEDNSWKVLAGYRFNPYLAVEGNYIDFGEAKAPLTPASEAFDAEAKGFAVYAVGLVPVSMFDLYAKAGAARIDGEGRLGAVAFEDDDTEFAYGVGARLRLQNFGVHAEYEKFDTDVVGDLDLISLGVTYSFGGAAY